MGCLGALPIFLASVLLEKSGVDFFRKIDQDTKLYVVQVFGAKRNFPVSIFQFVAALRGRFEMDLRFEPFQFEFLSICRYSSGRSTL